MGNPGSNRDAETGTWKLVSGMKIYETSRISIHVSDPLTSWKIKINELLASALWELSFCPELVLARRCYTLTGSSTDTRTARSKWKIGMMKGEAEVSRFTKKLDWSAGDWKKDSQLFISNRLRVKRFRGQGGCLSWQKKTQEFFRWSHWKGGLIFWDSREECPQGEVRKVQRTRGTCDPSNKRGELLFCWWWFRLEHFCQINTPPWSRIDWWSD